MLKAINRSTWVAWLLPALVGTLLSMARTGHVSGRWNNFFHQPILAGLPAMPQFAGDAFVQTLPFYASSFWQMFAGRVPIDALPAFLLAWAVLSRFLAILAFLACADLLGIRSLGQRLIFVALIAFSAVLQGFSSAGGGGLLLNYFTHSELANATILFTIWLAARGRYAGAMAINGVTFFLNAFMAVWALAPMVAIAVVHWRRGDLSPRAILTRVAWGTPIFLLLAFPTLWAILSNPAFGKPPGFDYVAFLAEYAPVHFLVWKLGIGTLITLAAVVATGASAAWVLARDDRDSAFCLAALGGFCLLWLAGAILPFLSHSPTLLNLHLLRASVGIHLFAGLAIAALSTKWLVEDGARRRFWAPLLILGASFGRPMLPMSLAAIWGGRRPLALKQGLRLDRVAIALLALLWPMQIVIQARFNAVTADRVVAWQAIGQWAKAHSRPDDIFMLPLSTGINSGGPWQAPYDQEQLENGAEIFQTAAARRVWVDFRAGAAVMWSPGYYRIWHGRIAETIPLDDHAKRLAYARSRGIAYLVDGCGGAGIVLFAVRELCVYDVAVQPLMHASKPYRLT